MRTLRKRALQIRRMGFIAASVWDLPLKDIRFNEAALDVYGRCWIHQGMIEIRLFSIKDPLKPMRLRSVIRTLAHELAHLRIAAHTTAHRELSDAIYLWFRMAWKRFSRSGRGL